MNEKAYEPQTVASELRRSASERFGWDNTTEGIHGSIDLRVEYRAAIAIESQRSRLELLEATLCSIALAREIGEAVHLAEGAIAYPAKGIPMAISTEDGDPAWVEVTAITQTPIQVVAALKANGMWASAEEDLDDPTEHGYDVVGKVWCVPTLGRTETALLTKDALAAAENDPKIWDEDILWFESPEHEGCETGAWWWRCDERYSERTTP